MPDTTQKNESVETVDSTEEALQLDVLEAVSVAERDTPTETQAEIDNPAAESTGSGELEQAATEEISAASPFPLLFQAPDLSQLVPEQSDDEDDEDDSSTGRRSRRGSRGRRGRQTRNDQGSDSADLDEVSDDDESEDDGSGQTGTHRRRRRLKKGESADFTPSPDDPPNTVIKVRQGREASDDVLGVKGSTRLEAKKRRRREGRDAGRRRSVIVTEAEFLARRESVERTMLVRQKAETTQMAVLEDGVLVEHYVSRQDEGSLIGNVYLGKVQNVLPSMEAAFVDIGRGRNAVLYAGEVNWDAAGLEGQPKRIEFALKSGDRVLVQVTKDPVGHKGARLTSQVSLPGRYLVYVPGGSITGISRKLPDVERTRLKGILKDIIPESAGVIVRTAAEGASEEELAQDVARLKERWEEIDKKAKNSKITAPELLYGEPDLTVKIIRDVFNEDFSKLTISGDEAWNTINNYLEFVAPDLLPRLEKWESVDENGQERDIFAQARVDEQIRKALGRVVYLPSGGSLVIDRTEAMTVIDVNTGKFVGSGGNLEETVTKNNLESAEEIARQLRLRDIGGIIVIDFIDMVLESNRDLVLRRLVECLSRDRTKHQVAEVTSLGLVQMTRKKIGTGLLEAFSTTCETCGHRGVVKLDEPLEPQTAQDDAEVKFGEVVHDKQHEHGGASHAKKEKKRNRRNKNSKSGQGKPEQTHEHNAAAGKQEQTVEPVVGEEDRKARAQEVRHALAMIADATRNKHSQPNDETVEVNESHEQPVVTLEQIDLDSVVENKKTVHGAEKSIVPATDGSGQATSLQDAVKPAKESQKAERSKKNDSAGKQAGKQKPKGDEPIILGVGVPASDL